MKVSQIGGKTSISDNKRNDKISKPGDFALSLELADKEQTEQGLKEMLKDIDKLGKKLISTRSVEDAKGYKRKIQEYLSYIVKNIYKLKREPGPFNYGIHIRIEVINKKLDEITKQVIDEQKETIELADRIEEIRGLLVDVYK
jgi:uncharacterized protein